MKTCFRCGEPKSIDSFTLLLVGDKINRLEALIEYLERNQDA